jgi:hypothetical protein
VRSWPRMEVRSAVVEVDSSAESAGRDSGTRNPEELARGKGVEAQGWVESVARGHSTLRWAVAPQVKPLRGSHSGSVRP